MSGGGACPLPPGDNGRWSRNHTSVVRIHPACGRSTGVRVDDPGHMVGGGGDQKAPFLEKAAHGDGRASLLENIM